MEFSRFLLILLLFLPGLCDACAMELRKPGTPLDVPKALIEVRVVEARDIDDFEYRPGRFGQGQEIVVEVTRSLIGSRPPGERITKRHSTSHSCRAYFGLNMRLLLADLPDGPDLAYYGTAYEGEKFEFGFGAIADVDAPWRTSQRPGLNRVRLRGDVSDKTAESLLRRSRLDRHSGCDVVTAKTWIQVACGQSADGSGSPSAIVLFERVDPIWVEIARYPSGTATEAQ